MFDWPVVVGQYKTLFAELADRRAQALRVGAVPRGVPIQPSRGDPFADFRGFATNVLEPDLKLCFAEGALAGDLDSLLEVQLNRLYPGLRGTADEARALLDNFLYHQTACSPMVTVADLLADAPPERRPYLETTLVWLAKLGLVDWLPHER